MKLFSKLYFMVGKCHFLPSRQAGCQILSFLGGLCASAVKSFKNLVDPIRPGKVVKELSILYKSTIDNTLIYLERSRMSITISAIVKADVAKVWQAWTSPEDIKKWNTASDDWHTPHAEVDLRVDGKFLSRMEAKDGSMGFDFSGKYTNIVDHQLIEYVLEDGRKVSTEFQSVDDGVKINSTFDPEDQNSHEMQRQGWQAILNNFVKYVEST